MADPESLTLAYISSHPGEAARVLERIGASDAAAFIARVPARAGAPVLNAMLPSAAARVVGELESAIALSLLTATGTQSAIAILRQIPEPQRGQLIERLPTGVAMASKLLLGYSEDSVGAWADPDIVVLSPETTVGEAIERVKTGNETQVEQVFAVDRDQHLVGVIALHDLLRLPEAATLSGAMRKPASVLSAAATVTGTANQRGWQQSPALPVVERGGRLIGVLRRAALARALARNRQPFEQDTDAVLASVLARGYWDAVSGLTEAMVSLLPRARPIGREEP